MKNFLHFRRALVVVGSLLLFSLNMMAQSLVDQERIARQHFADKYRELGMPVLKGVSGTIPSLGSSYCSNGGYVDLVPPSWDPNAVSIQWTITTVVGTIEVHPTWGEYIGTGQSTVFRFYLDRVTDKYFGNRIYFDYIQRNDINLPVGTLNNDQTFVFKSPDIFTLGSDTEICAGQSASLVLNGSETGIEYVLLNESGNQVGFILAGDGNPITFSVNLGGTYTVEARNILENSCTVPMDGSATVTVNPLPVVTTANDGPKCEGDDVQLSGGPDGMISYTWTGPNAFTSNEQNPLVPAIMASGVGNYVLTVEDDKGCQNQAVTAVAVNEAPTGVISGTADICSGTGTELTFTLTGVGPWNVVYTDGTNDYPLNNIASSPHVVTVTPLTDVSYTLKSVSDSNMPVCSASALSGSADITIIPNPTAAISGDADLCDGASTDLTFVLTGTAPWNITYSDGSNTNSVVANASPFILSVSPSASPSSAQTIYTYVVTALSDANCSALAADMSGTATVTVNPVPAVTIISNQDNNDFCPGTDVLFTASGAGEYTFYKNGIEVQVRSAINTYSDDTLVDGDIISVEGFDINYPTECSASAQITVAVFDPPLVAPSYDPACENGDLQLYANRSGGTAGFSYAWSHASNGFTSSDENPLISNVDKSIYEGLYTLTLTDANGCVAQADVDVFINDLPVPTINGDANATSTTLCEGEAISLVGGGGLTYIWTLPDGSTFTGQNLDIAGAGSGTHDGTYMLTVNDGTCINTLTHEVIINVNPIVSLVSDQSDDTFCKGTNVTFTASGADEYIFYKNSIAAANIVQAQSANDQYSTDQLLNGDQIIVEGINTSTFCTSSTMLSVRVNEVIANISISSPGAVICSGTNVLFSAGATITPSAGASFTYDFRRIRGGNDVSVQNSGASSYNDNTLQNGDQLYVVATDAVSGCSDASGMVTITVNDNPVVALTADFNPVCEGELVTFTASPGDYVNYDFYVNGTLVQSGSTDEYASSTLGNGDVVFVEATNSTSCISNSIPVTMTVNPLPVPGISGNFSSCVNGTQIYTTESGYNNYLWTVTGGTVVSGGTVTDHTIEIQWTTTGNQSLSVSYETPEGCSPLQATVEAVTVYSLPAISIIGETETCIDGTYVYSTQTGMSNYNWTITGGTLLADDGNGTVSVQWSASGAASVAVNYDNSNGCNAASDFVLAVNVNDLPVPGITGNSSVCLNSTDQYQTVAGHDNYIWDVVGGTIIPTADPHIVDVQWDAPGAQSISVNYSTLPGNCTAVNPTVFNVTVNDLPVPGIIGNTEVCEGSTGNVYATELNMSNYTWTVVGGIIESGQGSNEISVTWDVAGTQLVSVAYVDANGCLSATPTELVVNVNALPVPGINGSATVCNGTTQSYVTESGMTNYLWTITSGGTIISGQGTESIVVDWATDLPQVITVTYTDINSCDPLSPTSHDVAVVDLPTPTISGSDVVCENHTVTYTTQSGASNYDWQVVGGSIVSPADPTQSHTVDVLWSMGAGAQISVNYELASCPAAAPYVMPVTVNAIPLITVSGPTDVCVNSSGHIYSTEPGFTNYIWTVSGGTISDGDGTEQITVTWDQEGSGSVEVNYDNFNNCSAVSPAHLDVNVNALPVATLSGSQTVCNNYSVIYTTESGMNNYSWTVTGGTIVSDDNNGTVDVLWDTVGDQSLTVTYTDPLTTCAPALPAQITVAVQDAPVPAITGNSSVCETNLEIYSTEAGHQNYTWNIIGGTIVSGEDTETIMVQWTGLGNQQVSVNYELAGGCAAPDATVLDINVHALAGVGLTASPATSVIGGTPIIFTATGTDVVDYQFKINGSEVSSHDGSDTFNWTPADSNDSNTSIRVIATTSNGCTDSTELIINVYDNIVPADVEPLTQNYCAGSPDAVSIYLSGMVMPGLTYELIRVEDGQSMGSINAVDATTDVRWTHIVNAVDFTYSGTATYKVEAYWPDVPAERFAMANEVTVTETVLPESSYSINPSGSVDGCNGGSGYEIKLSNSEADVAYILTVDGVQLGSAVAGTGSEISFGTFLTTGVYQVIGERNGCTALMNGTFTINSDWNGLTQQIVGDPADGRFCEGGSGVEVIMEGSEEGVVYVLLRNGSEVSGFEWTGDGSAHSFGLFTESGDYTVNVKTGSGCYYAMNGVVTISELTLPAAFSLYAENNIASYCPGESGVKLLLDNQEAGVRYTLFKDGAYAEDILASVNGGSLAFAGIYTAGQYHVTGNIEGLSCEAEMINRIDVIEDPLPQTLILNGDDSFCAGGGTAQLYINNPESGVTYELYRDGVATGDNGMVDNGQLIWTVGQEGSYTVSAVKNNMNTTCGPVPMDGMVSISMTNVPEDKVLTVVDGSDCQNGTVITVNASQAGIRYVVVNASTGQPVPGFEIFGDDGDISFSEIFDTDGYYWVEAYNGNCSSVIGDSYNNPIHVAIVGVVAKKTVDYQPSGAICVGSGGITIRVIDPEVDVDYVLYRVDGQNNEIEVDRLLQPHSTNPIAFAETLAEGVYRVVGYDDLNNDPTGCRNEMLNEVTVMYNPLPKSFRLTGADKYCDNSDAILMLDGSEAGYIYHLLLDDGTGNVPVETRIGDGQALSFVPVSQSGSYTVYSMSPDGCTSSMRDTVAVTQADAITMQVAESNSYEYCASEGGISIVLSDQQDGVLYQAVNEQAEVVAEGLGVGSGVSLELGPLSAGTYTLWGSYGGLGCRMQMNNDLSVVVIETMEPEDRAVSAEAYNVCGSSGTNIVLSQSQPGIEYYLLADGTPMDTLTGTGDDMIWEVYSSVSGVMHYQVVAIANTSCNKVMGDISISFLDGPETYTMFGEGGTADGEFIRYCQKDAGIQIGVQATMNGIAYILYKDFTDEVGFIRGDGNDKKFAGIFYGTAQDTTMYSVEAVDFTTGCSVLWADTIQVIEDELPYAFDLYINDINDPANTTTPIRGAVRVDELKLDGSYDDATYYLKHVSYNLDTTVVSAVDGTGLGLDFGNQAYAGFYHVLGVTDNGCSNIMQNVVRLDENDLIAVDDLLILEEGALGDTIHIATNDTLTSGVDILDDPLNRNIRFDVITSWTYDDGGTPKEYKTYGGVTINAAGVMDYKKSASFYGRDSVKYVIYNEDYPERRDTATVHVFIGNVEINDDNYLLVPNAFSPNGDGINDRYVVEGEFEHEVAESKLEVFNRWGTIVYRSLGKRYDNSWDGKSNAGAMVSLGKNLPEGTYFYVFTITITKDDKNKETREYNGFIEIRR